jgi:hypothetical protein
MTIEQLNNEVEIEINKLKECTLGKIIVTTQVIFLI